MSISAAILVLASLLVAALAVRVPAPIAATPAGFNCEPLSDVYQARWKVAGDQLMVELVGKIRADYYMAFGPGGSQEFTLMTGSDPVIVDLFEGEFRALDYFISARQECFRNRGVCPDESNDVEGVSGERDRDAGITLVRYTRPLAASEANDIAIDPTIPTLISWATQISREDGLPARHTPSNHSRDDFSITFGRPIVDNCEPLATVESGPPVATEAPSSVPVTPTRPPPASTSVPEPPTETDPPNEPETMAPPPSRDPMPPAATPTMTMPSEPPVETAGPATAAPSVQPPPPRPTKAPVAPTASPSPMPETESPGPTDGESPLPTDSSEPSLPSVIDSMEFDP